MRRKIRIRRWTALGIAAMMLATLPAFDVAAFADTVPAADGSMLAVQQDAENQNDEPIIEELTEGQGEEEGLDGETLPGEVLPGETLPGETTPDENLMDAEGIDATEGVPQDGAIASEVTVPAAPTGIKRSRTKNTVKISWNQTGEVDGYDVCYADNRLFLGVKKVTVKDGAQTSCTVRMARDRLIYVKVRAWNKIPKTMQTSDAAMTIMQSSDAAVKTLKSSWTFSKNVTSNRHSGLTRVKKKGKKKKLDLRKVAKQKIRGYDTVQGSCYGRGYVYYLLYNRSCNRCKIVKLKLSNGRKSKVSASEKLYHGNDMTYNEKRNVVVIAHASPDGKRLSVVSPTTLRILKTYTVELPSVVPGLTDNQANLNRLNKKGGYSGFSSIAYNNKHDQYVVQMYNVRDFMILDRNFRPVRYIRLKDKAGQTYQGIETCGDYIIQSCSFLGDKKYNILSVYDWEGNYLSKIRLNKGMELESIFLVGTRMYASYYRSYIKTIIKTIKEEKEVEKVVKKKIKKGKHKGEYKKVKKKVKEEVEKKIKIRKLQRDGYLYRIKSL